MQKNTYKIYTLGCKVNQYDSLALSKKLDSAYLLMVKENCYFAIINTCVVTKTAILKCKRIIKKARKENPKGKIILTGCWIKVEKKINEKVDVICSKERVVAEIRKLANAEFRILNKNSLRGNRKSRYFIKIQDGCDQFCTYCIIPYARGKLKSRGEANILKEIKEVVGSGVREIVLCGIHLGKFKMKNLKCKNSLVLLLKSILKINDLGRIRLSSIEINEVEDDLIKLIKDSVEKHRIEGSSYVCRHLHLPMQSGSDKILKLMNRSYNKNKFKSKISKIRKLIPSVAITTDIIAGFPGETKKDFLETYNFAKEMKFSKIHVFPFSAHNKVPASSMSNQIPKEEKDIRANKLRRLSEKLEKKYRDRFRGNEVEVVVENFKNNKLKGTSEFYFNMEQKIKNSNSKLGEIVKLKT